MTMRLSWSRSPGPTPPPAPESRGWQRIATAIAAGDDDAQIARRLKVARAHVAHVRAALAPGPYPPTLRSAMPPSSFPQPPRTQHTEPDAFLDHIDRELEALTREIRLAAPDRKLALRRGWCRLRYQRVLYCLHQRREVAA